MLPQFREKPVMRPSPGPGPHSAQEHRVYPRIGLLTPYAGTNLGDAAIQAAAIEGIRRQIPRAELWGITLNPQETGRLHGIPGFPITGLLVAFYSESLFDPISGITVRFRSQSKVPGRNGERPEARRPTGDSGRIWTRLKAAPVLGGLLLRLLRLVRRLFAIASEMRHLKASFGFVRTLDMVMVSGGGQLDEAWGGAWGHPYALFRWAILARLAGRKFAVVSVGVGELETLLGRFFTRAALALACYRSYRDSGSKALVSGWSFTRDDPCVPDLAFGLGVPSGRQHSVASAPLLTIGVNPIAFGHGTNWPKPDRGAYESYLSNLAQVLAKLLSQGHRLLLFASSGADRRVGRELLDKLSRECPASSASQVSVPPIVTLEDFISEVSRTDVVIASRLHGTMLSHMLGKPVLAISFDRKVDAHMHDMGQSDYALDIRSFSPLDLMERFASLAGDAARIRTALAAKTRSMRNPLDAQYRRLAQLLDAPS